LAIGARSPATANTTFAASHSLRRVLALRTFPRTLPRPTLPGRPSGRVGPGIAPALGFDDLVFALILSTLLAAEAPIDAPRRSGTKLTWRLSVGSFLGSVWAAPSFRRNVEAFKDEQMDWMEDHGSVFDSSYLVYAAPVLGPWLTLIRGGTQAREDMWMLITSGVLQGIGITTLTYRALTQRSAPVSKDASHDDGLVLDISPYVAGRLGISLTLTGW
jgi:hypothetical protein